MKTILMLIVGLMLAGCGSTGNHVRNRDAVDRNRYLVEHNAVDTICACPCRLNHGVASTYRPALQDRATIASDSRASNDLPRLHRRILHALRRTALCD